MKNSPWPAPPHDAPLPRQPDVPGPRKATLRRYTWVRCHHEVLRDDLWGLVAEMAASDRPAVEAFIQRLEIYANGNLPRGSVLGFNVAALAVTWRRDRDELARILVALEHPDVGWIEDDLIVTFYDRNPDEEDATAAERSKRYRLRQKVLKRATARKLSVEETLAELDAAGVPYPQAKAITRDGVTVTARADQTKQPEAENAGISTGDGAGVGPQAIHRESGTFGDDPAQARVWLAFHGKRIIAQRLNEPPTRAQQRIERWLAQMADDAVALAALIDKADASSDAVVAQFLQLIGTSVSEYRRREKGPALPFGPTLATTTKRSSHG